MSRSQDAVDEAVVWYVDEALHTYEDLVVFPNNILQVIDLRYWEGDPNGSEKAHRYPRCDHCNDFPLLFFLSFSDLRSQLNHYIDPSRQIDREGSEHCHETKLMIGWLYTINVARKLKGVSFQILDDRYELEESHSEERHSRCNQEPECHLDRELGCVPVHFDEFGRLPSQVDCREECDDGDPQVDGVNQQCCLLFWWHRNVVSH